MLEVPPRDIESEKIVLACILLDAKAIYTASDILTDRDFYVEPHRIIFSSMQTLRDENIPIDIWTLKSELQRKDKLQAAGGIVGLSTLMDGIPVQTNLDHYCNIVKQKSVSRSLMSLAHNLQVKAAGQEETPQDLIEETQRQLLDLYGRYQSKGLQPMNDVVDAGMKELEERRKTGIGSGITTGFSGIDNIIGGMRPGNMIILAARPGIGKTALAVNIVNNVSSVGSKAAVFSLEMGNSEIYCRMIATEAQMCVSTLLGASFAKDRWDNIINASARLYSRPIMMDDSGSISMMQLAARCRKMKMDTGLDFAVIDYLQLISGPGRSRYDRVTDISREIKILAKDLKIPILVLSQLHRLENEDDEPGLSDLRESGAIEQDADIVMFLWHGGTSGYRKGKIAKQRNGPIGYFDLGFNEEQTRFYSCTMRENYAVQRVLEG
jgi:replicative DNA helicase